MFFLQVIILHHLMEIMIIYQVQLDLDFITLHDIQ